MPSALKFDWMSYTLG